MIRYTLCALALAAACGRPGATRSHSSSVTPDLQRHFIASWAPSPQPTVHPLPLSGQTLRQIAHLSAGGSRLRVRLSNAYGTVPLRIGAAHVALHGRDSAIVAGSDCALTFGGATSVTVPPGALAVSDPVPLQVTAASDLAISLYLPEPVSATTVHAVAMQTSYLSPPGDFTAAPALAGATPLQSWYFLGGVDVEAAAQARTIVALGDSITDGMGSTLDGNRRWPDRLAARLAARPGAPVRAVVDAGISGNALLRDLGGVKALARLDRDVLAQPGGRYLIVLEGINDISPPDGRPPTLEELIGADRQIIERAHALGWRVYGGTLTQLEGSAAKAEETLRQGLNRWIRGSGAFDAVIDFDAATRDPARPATLRAAFDSGDQLHPNDAGYQAMADAVDLGLF